MRDLHNNITPRRGISPVAAGTDNTAIVSQIVDMRDHDSAEFVILTGTNTDADATFAVLLEDGNDSGLSDAATVPAAQTLGTVAQAGFTFADDNKCFKIGYAGNKRYARVTITPTGNNSGNIFVAGVWILGHPVFAPTSNPPV
jgi:hypothetical protein